MIKNKWNNHKLAAESMAFLMVCLFLLFSFWNPVMSYAKDSFLAGYMQSVYNQKSGIGSNEVNCLFQSSSGYIWAGTDGGLYRSNGSGFQSIDLWDTIVRICIRSIVSCRIRMDGCGLARTTMDCFISRMDRPIICRKNITMEIKRFLQSRKDRMGQSMWHVQVACCGCAGRSG